MRIAIVIVLACSRVEADPTPSAPSAPTKPVHISAQCAIGTLTTLASRADNVTFLRGGGAAVLYQQEISLLSDSGAKKIATTWDRSPDFTPEEAIVELGDGSLLVAGGSSGGNSTFGVAATKRFDVTGRALVVGDLPEGRFGLNLLPLLDGGALVVGGRTLHYSTSALGKFAVVPARLDPRSLQWNATGPLARPRGGAGAVRLIDGRVLVFGGIDVSDATQSYADATPLADVDMFDPETDTFRATAPIPRLGGRVAAAVSHDGRVLVLSSKDTRTDVFDPATETWTDGPDLPLVGRAAAAAVDCTRMLVVVVVDDSLHAFELDLAARAFTPVGVVEGSFGAPRVVAVPGRGAFVTTSGTLFQFTR